MPSPDAAGEAMRAGRYAQSRLINAAFAELIGLCRGVLADGELQTSEIEALDRWLVTHEGVVPDWPAGKLQRRVRHALAQGDIDPGERADLMHFLEQMVGEDMDGRQDRPTSLPLTIPVPIIEYAGHAFCLTGTFLYGPRTHVEVAIRDQGGEIATISHANYLIIGGTVTAAWKFSTHGTKIEQAVARVQRGQPLAIVCEQDWSPSLT